MPKTGDPDTVHMARALALAKSQQGRTGQNPSVGCVIIAADGTKLSEAATGDGGARHAEETALSTLQDGEAEGGTAYVTLEPCRQRSAGGRSCSERLLEAGIARLVCAHEDLHPNGAGGFDRLRDAGVVVEVGIGRTEAAAIYEGFFATLK
ncbi:MAG: riboflavin biosynthesis protein RibD [Pseudomonadota bacterium]